MTGVIATIPRIQFFDIHGKPLVGGKLYTYLAGSTTPAATFQDQALTIKNENPVPLDATGSAVIWLDPTKAYKFVLEDFRGASQPGWPIDNVVGAANPISLAPELSSFAKLASLAAAAGSALLGFLQAGTGAGARTVQDKLRESVSVTDFFKAGEADATNMIQRALNASTGRRLFFPTATYVTTGNEVPSNSHLVFERGAILRLADGSHRPALQNVNFKKASWGGSTYGLDSNITIEGMYLDGNQAGQDHTGTGVYAGEYTSGIRFGGVTNLVLKDITVYQTRTFGIWVYAIYNLTAHDIRFDQYMGGPPDNQDGLHVNGPAMNLDIRNIRGSTNDDMIALNADDSALGANVTAGAITGAVIDGVYPVNCLNGVRLLSGVSRMDQIIVKNVVGSTRDVAVNQAPYGTGPGNVGSLIIENIDVHCSNPFQSTTSYYYAVISLDGIIESVSLTDIKNNRPDDNRPTVLIAGTANIAGLEIDGLTIVEVGTSGLNGVKPIAVYGFVDTMVIRGVHYFRDSLLTPTGNLLYINAPGKGITNLNCSDWVVQRLVEPIYLADGRLDNATLSNIDDRGGLPGYALLDLNSASGATTNVDISNCSTGAGRKLVARGGASVFGQRVTIDKAGASGANASPSGNQALAAGAYTKLAFSVETYDRIGEYDTAAQTFTVTQGPGTYQVSCSVDLAVPTNPTTIVLALYKGGVLSRVLANQQLTGDTTVIGNVLVSVQQGDVYDVRLYCSNAMTAKNTASSTVFYERLK